MSTAEKFTPDWSRTHTSFDNDPNISNRYKAKLRKDRERFIHNIHKDPCYEERQMTLKCLQLAEERSDCEIYSQNSLMCRDFWARVVKDRKRKKIEPNLPPVEERPAVLKEYADWLKR
ncbi:Coiled-coil-helix-coiled-coil-helix domain-containing protein 7 [Mactra antiquata]